MSEDLVLWGIGTPRTLRAHWTLRELGLHYTSRPILPRSGETKTPEYTALNPRQKIPLLQDGDFIIGESAAIAAYLSQKYSHRGCRLHPEEPGRYATWLEWCFFIIAELDATTLYVIRRHGTNLGHLYADAPEVVATAGEYFRQQLRHVETALADGRTYLMGDQFTTADILLGTCLTWAIDYKVGICDNAVPYLERLTSRDAYKVSKEQNTATI
jgi:glutathione S-transferase